MPRVVRVTPATLIRAAMKEMSQIELARRTGVTPKHVCCVLAGKAPVRTGFALALELALGISPAMLLAAQAREDLRRARRLGKRRCVMT